METLLAIDIFLSNPSFVCFLHLLGSNGQDFPSRCHLERDACERRVEDLVVRYEGKCNPCQGFECSDPHQECHIDLSSRNPVCDCNTDCANETAPVCASNGKTVSSTKLQMASFLKEVKVKEIVLREGVLPTLNKICLMKRGNYTLLMSILYVVGWKNGNIVGRVGNTGENG